MTNASDRLVIAALSGGVVRSRAELAAATGLPKTTITGIAGRLLRSGVLVSSHRPGEGRGRGRPAAGLALAAPAEPIAVLALSHATIRAAAVGWDGTIAGYAESPLDAARDERRVFDRGLAMLAEVLPGPPSRAVVSMPTAFRPGVGAVLGQVPPVVRAVAPELAGAFGWLRSDPGPIVAARLGVPVTVDNFGNLAALGEATFGAGRGLTDILYVKVVEGIGAGLVLGGRVHRGSGGLAGELAHVQVADDGPWCVCGSRGCLATTYGGLVPPFRPAYPSTLTAAGIRDLAAAGERGTLRIMADAGRRVGRVLADACVWLCPEAVIVDGMLGAAAEPFLTGVREMIHRHTPAVVGDGVRVLAGTLAERAEILGAVALSRIEVVTPVNTSMH